jgi:hypothetical protein
VTTYIVLFTTSGCPSWPPSTPVENVQTFCSFLTFAAVICERSLNRVEA